MKLEYVVDDRSVAERFISELPAELKRMRFSGGALAEHEIKGWRPTHMVVAVYDGVLAAMADCVISSDGKRGNYSLICKDGYGGYALRAMHQLKKRFPVEVVEASFRNPTGPLLKMGRWWADYIYDQDAWHAAGNLCKQIGFHPSIEPAPIAITDSNLETFGIPDPDHWCERSRMQLAAAFLDPNGYVLSTEKCAALPRSVIVALILEALAIPYEERQRFTRSELAQAVVKLGIVPPDDATASAWTDARLGEDIRRRVSALGPEHAPLQGPIFKLARSP